jgi:transposase
MRQLTTRERRQMIAWHVAHGENIPATCAQFHVSRATLYRWLARHAATPGEPLRAQSRRPHTTRASAWSSTEIERLCALTLAHPTWGRGRLAAALAAQAEPHHSAASVGRMLAWIRTKCPICRGRHSCHSDLQHVLHHVLTSRGLSKPLRAPGPDPAKKALRRAKAATVREAEALLRGQH